MQEFMIKLEVFTCCFKTYITCRTVGQMPHAWLELPPKSMIFTFMVMKSTPGSTYYPVTIYFYSGG